MGEAGFKKKVYSLLEAEGLTQLASCRHFEMRAIEVS